MKTYHAFRVTELEGQIISRLEEVALDELKDNEVLIKGLFSSINYKDALATQKNGGVIRHYPMTPGIDMAGEIEESRDPKWPVGTQVLVTGFGLGVQQPGGFSQYQIVPSHWLVALPTQLTKKEAMIYGTAGFTAALAVKSITDRLTDKNAPIVITGASGGVSSIAIALLNDMGYSQLTAITRKKEAESWLLELGAKAVITPDDFLPEKNRPLDRQLFAGMIDTVGGELLSRFIPFIQYDGTIALCGNAGGADLHTTVFPFILRAIRLVGIDSVSVPIEKRAEIWSFLASHKTILKKLPLSEVHLTTIQEQANLLLAGNHQGRSIVHLGEIL